MNLIGEHTDYNQGLALPFAIAEGVTVRRHRKRRRGAHLARALDHGEEDEFALAEPPRATGWRAFVRGVVAELRRAGYPLVGARLEIGGDLPRGAGLSSSAALEVALCLALLARLIGAAGTPTASSLARLCSRVESEWVGAQTGLLDQLASLYGAPDTALRIDFQTLEVDPVPLRLEGGWRLVTLDSGERHAQRELGLQRAPRGVRPGVRAAGRALAAGGERGRARAAARAAAAPRPSRAGENRRVETRRRRSARSRPTAVGASWTSATPACATCTRSRRRAVEATVARLLDAGAAGRA